MLTLGIDDAGRGPLIGPMILAGVLVDKNSEAFLKKIKVNDSKLLAHSIRIKLGKLIKESAVAYEIVKAAPEQIDNAISSGINLNTLEAMKTAEIINSINQGKLQKQKIKVIVDCPSTNIAAWRNKLISYIKNIDNLDVHCEHKADANYPAVSAASIIAKVQREEEVGKLRKEYGEIGSGYPSDPATINFLKKHGSKFRNSGIFRKSWQTWKSLYPADSQKKISEF